MPASAVPTHFASDAVRAAAADPAIAAVLAASARAHAAAVQQDVEAFAADQAPELIVNSPADRVLSGPQTIGAFKAGLIDYASTERTIEHAALRPNGEVLLMGAEVVTPRNRTHNAGKTVSRRVTEIWRPDPAGWKLAIRQATDVAVK